MLPLLFYNCNCWPFILLILYQDSIKSIHEQSIIETLRVHQVILFFIGGNCADLTDRFVVLVHVKLILFSCYFFLQQSFTTSELSFILSIIVALPAGVNLKLSHFILVTKRSIKFFADLLSG